MVKQIVTSHEKPRAKDALQAIQTNKVKLQTLLDNYAGGTLSGAQLTSAVILLAQDMIDLTTAIEFVARELRD